MKFHRILFLSVAILIPQMAGAELPFSNDTFGKIEGILDFCAKANPQAATKYQEGKVQLVNKATEKEVTDARKTQEYKDSFASMSDQLSTLPKKQAVEACAASLAESK
jgi:hypothetical protein